MSSDEAEKAAREYGKPRKRITDKDRILRNILVVDSGCWEWQRWCGKSKKWSKASYGVVTVPTGKRGGKREQAHRVSYTAFKGPIPTGMWVLHSCDNTRCCNPDHLFLGDSSDNVEDCKRKNRTAYGERNGNVKITRNDALAIRRMAWVFKLPLKYIAAEFKLSLSSVDRIARGIAWKSAFFKR